MRKTGHCEGVLAASTISKTIHIKNSDIRIIRHSTKLCNFFCGDLSFIGRSLKSLVLVVLLTHSKALLLQKALLFLSALLVYYPITEGKQISLQIYTHFFPRHFYSNEKDKKSDILGFTSTWKSTKLAKSEERNKPESINISYFLLRYH